MTGRTSVPVSEFIESGFCKHLIRFRDCCEKCGDKVPDQGSQVKDPKRKANNPYLIGNRRVMVDFLGNDKVEIHIEGESFIVNMTILSYIARAI